MSPRLLCALGGALLLGGCLQRVTPEMEAPVSGSVSADDAGVSAEALSCAEFRRRNMPAALVTDGGADAGPMTPSLDKDEIRRIITSHRSEIVACYEGALEGARRPIGTVAVRFGIAKTGEVGCSEIARSTVGNPGLERCIAAAVSTWRFPQPLGGGVVMVTYPFAFRAITPRDAGIPGPADAGADEVEDFKSGR